MDKKKFAPESLMMSYGYKPELSEGALKCPIFQTSTFVFENAEHGKAFFEVAYGLREQEPGDLLLYSRPVYGGTNHFITQILPKFGINVLGFSAKNNPDQIRQMLKESDHQDNLAMIYVETPANPTNDLIDLEACSKIANEYSTDDKEVLMAVDNTYLGPIWQNPLEFGTDLVLYSATKFLGGHSDVIAGACLGSEALMGRVKTMRTFLGNMAGPWTGWLLMRSLETLKLRMEKQVQNAEKVSEFLREHPKVEKVYYLGFLEESNPEQFDVYKRQCLSNGSMLSFDIKGGESEAFTFLNNLELIHLAVSLGSTESLAQHPATMTHADVDPEEKEELSISEKLVRLSIGIENPDDLISDISHALDKV